MSGHISSSVHTLEGIAFTGVRWEFEPANVPVHRSFYGDFPADIPGTLIGLGSNFWSLKTYALEPLTDLRPHTLSYTSAVYSPVSQFLLRVQSLSWSRTVKGQSLENACWVWRTYNNTRTCGILRPSFSGPKCQNAWSKLPLTFHIIMTLTQQIYWCLHERQRNTIQLLRTLTWDVKMCNSTIC